MAFNNTNTSQSQPSAASSNEEEAQQQKKNSLIILVDKDSNDKLDELFDKTLSNKLPLQVPYHMRKLPASFFNPPSSGSKSPSVSHSRENSADSAFGSGTTIGAGQNNVAPVVAPSAIPSGLAIHHSRAHSSPASLGKLPLNINLNLSALNLGSVTPTNSSPSPNHSNSNINNTSSNNSIKQQHATGAVSNANNTSTSSSSNNSNSLLNNLSGSGSNQSTNNNLPHNILDKTLQHIHARGRSYDIPSLQHQIQFGELPSGWEQAKTNDGKIYYIK